MYFFVVVGDDLIIAAPDGREVWRGRPEDYPVAFATPIPGTDDGLVLYDPYPPNWQQLQSYQNLVRLRPDGTVVWHAELPEKGSKYINVKLDQAGVKALAPSFRIVLDLDSGKIREKVWTK